MRTNIDLDDKLLKEAQKLSENVTKKDLIHEALELYVKVKSRKSLRDLKGKISFRKGYDHKKLRVS
jgi:Arc/MetJ family transcription regulator